MKAIEASLRSATASTERERRTTGKARTAPAATEYAVEEVPERSLFISVKPRYADAILAGTKTVELRRTRPNLPDGSLVILYSSTPTRAVVGWAHLTGVRVGTPTEIWAKYGTKAAIDEPDYDAYFDGTDQAFALELNSVVAAVQPIPLDTIRSIGIQPPQSWRYVPADVTTQIQASALA
ncbi:MAG TPA: ASCH domain-containing protein [Nocardioides sp.]|uniref:ASCH domain-containing protein n=1 Tax=Nocardioides sp. TaxID=35761 RepID=UPI002C905469|nr:ASCH domain-containing protein [Nocardioides sp.]HTW17290.1 ASCH domain-containing protein [Nocardioides sp.]